MSDGYVLHLEADTDLIQIWSYIAADSVDAADQLLDYFRSTIHGLVRFPRQGHKRPDLRDHLLFQTAGTI